MTCEKYIRRDQRHTSCPVDASITAKSYVWPDRKLNGTSFSVELITVRINLVPPETSVAWTSNATVSSEGFATLSAKTLVFCSGGFGCGSEGAPCVAASTAFFS